jgi:transcriptional regulator with XRE-family HTH domain
MLLSSTRADASQVIESPMRNVSDDESRDGPFPSKGRMTRRHRAIGARLEAAGITIERIIGAEVAFAPTFTADDQTASFAEALRNTRRRVSGKQVSLSIRIGCTDAAISLWECGARLPSTRSFCRILCALAEDGASTSELLALRGAWHRELTSRLMKPRAPKVGPESASDHLGRTSAEASSASSSGEDGPASRKVEGSMVNRLIHR